jgi:thymidylate synthase (FAD)
VIVLGNGYVELLDHMGDDLAIVNAARKSFGSESQAWEDRDTSLLRYLYDNKHSSPFEMVEFKFAVKCPLFVARQWHRHRTWSYNEVSRRYTSDGLDFHLPRQLRLQDSDNKQASSGTLDTELSVGLELDIVHALNTCVDTYENLIAYGVCREQARMVLPQSMMVEMVAKVDLKNLLDFLRLRLHPHAQWEIQQYARAILTLIEPIVPRTVALFKETL